MAKGRARSRSNLLRDLILCITWPGVGLAEYTIDRRFHEVTLADSKGLSRPVCGSVQGHDALHIPQHHKRLHKASFAAVLFLEPLLYIINTTKPLYM